MIHTGKWIDQQQAELQQVTAQQVAISNKILYLTLRYPSSRKLLLLEGSLQGVFAFAGVHLHWSSEYTIDQKQFPIEMHIVFYNPKYTSVEEAEFHENGLAVVGYFFTNNSSAKSGRYGSIQYMNLGKIIGTDMGEYFVYLGSLTTPPCYETVTWIIRKKPLLISNMQLRHREDIHSYLKEPSITQIVYSNFYPCP
ncbi:carbonic anhydrase 2-like [Wyeomyia smithii]|uniref:carbonic anhydrase 2-like n=1 Tax=Wyeomyia smithii TaxID=174621 RepID=UPI00246821DE|nr:carbonic anhydrase 2-like [Wyeomyia smithii]